MEVIIVSAKIIVIVVQVMSIFAFLAIITALIRVNNAYKLEKRISMEYGKPMKIKIILTLLKSKEKK